MWVAIFDLNPVQLNKSLFSNAQHVYNIQIHIDIKDEVLEQHPNTRQRADTENREYKTYYIHWE